MKGDTITDVERFLSPESGRPSVDLSRPFWGANAWAVEDFEGARRGGPASERRGTGPLSA